jgi:hypothetical protein
MPLSTLNRLFPAGVKSAPGVAVGSTTSGVAQLSTNTLSIVNAYQGSAPNQNHNAVHFLDNSSIQIGNPSAAYLLPNQSCLEITGVSSTVGGSSVPLTIGQWGPDSAAAEPIIFYRSRGATIGSSGQILSSDSMGSLQFQGDLGDGTANVAAVNIIGRVQGGTTPIAGNTRGLAGNIALGTSPGDGSTAILTRFEITNAGHVNIVSGALQLGGVTTIDASRNLTVAGFRTTRVAIADDGVLVFQPYGGTTCIINLISTNTAATNAPAGFIWFRVNSLTAPQAVAMIGSAGCTFVTGALAGTTGTDGKLNLSSDAVGNLYIENRLGSSRTYAITVFSGAA